MSDNEARDELMRILNNEGAYCGDCGYEEGYDGSKGCSQCAHTLRSYADAILTAGYARRVDVLRDAAAHIERRRPEMGPNISVSQYREGLNDGITRALTAIDRALSGRAPGDTGNAAAYAAMGRDEEGSE